MDIPSRYNPKEVEDKWSEVWDKKASFHTEPQRAKKPYAIVIPPPNVTGILHMGHALNNTLQDILIRSKRMQGFNALWVPGTDHAGIATQNVVERELLKEKKTRHDLGRDDFVKRVWEWTKDNGGVIITQLKRLGCSCDWSRERFTLDKGYSKAVNDVFIRLYKEKLIYKGSYIINWCPRCQTALSDEEAPHKEIQGNLYYIKYALKDSDEFVTVATTRPETMFGDTALAVNPKDKRYKHLLGKKAILPIALRELDIIEDEKIDPDFGTGIVKVTPLHDPNDFDMGNRHKLKGILCMNPEGTMNINATLAYEGMDRFEAREALVEDLKERKLLESVKPHAHAVGHCYRCHTVVEPYFSEQWFVRMKPLSIKALGVVRGGKVRFYPKRWKKIYTNWMENIRDWCISRQIWWGHRIPAWYCDNCHKAYLEKRGVMEITLPLEISNEEIGIISVGENKPDKCRKCGCQDIKQDEDVLDTWFSSWLWPFAVFNWPDKTKDLNYFYPTSSLVTASEIIFFWVARMIMAGLYFMKKIPFSDVYIHGTVRDNKGRKMSKSLGNAIDPQKIIDKHGADALRFSLISVPGEDLYLSENKFEFGRNFINKVWNASRFILMNLDEEKLEDISDRELERVSSDEAYLAESWIVGELNQLIIEVEESISAYRFYESINKLYDFFWHKFCDWYIEIAKINIKDKTVQNVLFKVLKDTLKLLHPFIPFVTEEIWARLPLKASGKEELIMTSAWPVADKRLIALGAKKTFENICEITGSIRNIRMNFNISTSTKLKKVFVKSSNKTLSKYKSYIEKLAWVENVIVSDEATKPEKSSVAVIKTAEIYVPLEGLIDIEAEKEKLAKKVKELEKMLDINKKKLDNKDFIKRAPVEVVERTKSKCNEITEALNKTKLNLKELQ